MSQYAVAAALLLVLTEVVEGASAAELREKMLKRLRHEDSDKWRLEEFEIAGSTVQVMEVAASQIESENTSAA